MATTSSETDSNQELVSLMRELVNCLHQQSANDAASAPPAPQCQAVDSADGSVALQYGHSAARYNESMSQIAADKQLNYVRETQDRWHLMMKQLKAISE